MADIKDQLVVGQKQTQSYTMAENPNKLSPLPSTANASAASLPPSPQLKKKKKKREEGGLSSSLPLQKSSSPQLTSKPPTPRIQKGKLEASRDLSPRDREASIDYGAESDTPLLLSSTTEPQLGSVSISLASIIEPLDLKNTAKIAGKLEKKKRVVHVTSPITGEKILIQQEDLKKNTRISKNHSHQKKHHDHRGSPAPHDGIPSSIELSSLENLTGMARDELYIPPLDRTMPDVVFAADDGKTYRPIEKETYDRNLIEKSKYQDTEPILEAFSERFLRRRKYVFDFAMAVHSGLCLCTLLLLPTQSYSQTPITPRANCTEYPFSDSEILNFGTYPLPELRCRVYPASGLYYTVSSKTALENDGGDLFSFLLFYSPNALFFSIIFQIFSSLMLVGSWERMVHVMDSKRLTGGTHFLQRVVSLILVLCALISFACTVVMIYVDVNLSYSQAEYPSYAKYGEKYWMFDPISLNASYVIKDISEWITCNLLRGLFGLFQYFLWKLMTVRRKKELVMRHTSSAATMRIQPVP